MNLVELVFTIMLLMLIHPSFTQIFLISNGYITKKPLNTQQLNNRMKLIIYIAIKKIIPMLVTTANILSAALIAILQEG